jgi:hypothetical protein
MRRLLAGLLLAGALRADTRADLMDLFASMAAALADSNAPAFLAAFDPSMPGLDKLRIEVNALVKDAGVSSSVEMIGDQGDDQKHSVELDWFLEIDSTAVGAKLERRRQVVRCRLQRLGKHWKIVALEPLDFFAPPRLQD